MHPLTTPRHASSGDAGKGAVERLPRVAMLLVLLAVALGPARAEVPPLPAAPAASPDLETALAELGHRALPERLREDASGTLRRDYRRRLLEATRRENALWREVSSRAAWERFRDARIARLRESLGSPPVSVEEPEVHVTGRREGAGYTVENLVFESRPGLWVTANLYRPEGRAESVPAILLAHSHHNPKTQGELQDMGMTWARTGACVLVIDMLGHGERRTHPFFRRSAHEAPFRPGRQDYYFRYNTGLQLQLIGESLMGWMVQDLVRGVDVLLALPRVDPERLILIGSVAGGGDPAAVTAALDPRIRAVVPFNFGGPQPDYAIPEDAEDEFYWFGVPYWESTRCLRGGAEGGFAHWVIAASVAPRRLVYAHEFGWERERDPAWPRIRRVFSFYEAEERLAVVTGRGHLKGRPPESTHCNNVGPYHRRGLYPHLERWFGMPVPEEYSERRPEEDLLSMTPEIARELRPVPVEAVARKVAVESIAALRAKLRSLPLPARREALREAWRQVLGAIEPREARVLSAAREEVAGTTVERVTLETEPGIPVPLLLILPSRAGEDRSPAVLAVAREGKRALLAERRAEVLALVRSGATVCLADLRGTGETSPGSSEGPGSSGTTISASLLVLGDPLLASRLRDLRSLVRWLSEREDIDPRRISLWGESFAPPNPAERETAAPLRVRDPPLQGDPLGPLLVLLGALYEPEVASVRATGLLASFASALESPFIHLPHDVLAPGTLRAGDVVDLAAALAPRRVAIEALIDARNRRLSDASARTALGGALEACREAGAPGALEVSAEKAGATAAARRLLGRDG